MSNAAVDISTDKVFVQAVATIKSLTDLSKTTGLPRPSISDRLNLYGLYNQATRGDVSSMTNLDVDLNALSNSTELKKYNAWLKFKGLSKSQARRQYIKYLLNILSNNYSSLTYPDIARLKTNLQESWNRLENLSLSVSLNQNINKVNAPVPASVPVPVPTQPTSSTSVPNRLSQQQNVISRSHSPAASLYRIASSGVNSNMIRPPSRNQSISKSRNNSFSGSQNLPTVPPQSVSSNYTPSYAINNSMNYDVNTPYTLVATGGNNSYNNDRGSINALELMKWQGEINNTLLKISTELSNLKHQSSILEAGHRSISGSTTVSVQSEFQNYKLRSHDYNDRTYTANDYSPAKLNDLLERRNSGKDKETNDVIRWIYWKMITLVKYLRGKVYLITNVNVLAPKFIGSIAAVLFLGLFKKIVDIYLQKRFGLNLATSKDDKGLLQQWKQWLFRTIARRGENNILTL